MNPDEGVVPNFCDAAEKYSRLSGKVRGDGGIAVSDGVLTVQSDPVRMGFGLWEGDGGCEEFDGPGTGPDGVVEAGGMGPKNELLKAGAPETLGLMGEVAMAVNCESTMGLVTAV